MEKLSEIVKVTNLTKGQINDIIGKNPSLEVARVDGVVTRCDIDRIIEIVKSDSYRKEYSLMGTRELFSYMKSELATFGIAYDSFRSEVSRRARKGIVTAYINVPAKKNPQSVAKLYSPKAAEQMLADLANKSAKKVKKASIDKQVAKVNSELAYAEQLISESKYGPSQSALEFRVTNLENSLTAALQRLSQLEAKEVSFSTSVVNGPGSFANTN
jgi:hypothetical protein